jgi:hypothetical protein
VQSHRSIGKHQLFARIDTIGNLRKKKNGKARKL